VTGRFFEIAGQNPIRRNVVKRKLLYGAAVGILLLPSASWADFKYVESTKFTGGAMAGLVKFAAHVKGNGNGVDGSTYYIKGNRMRVEDGEGEVHIIDLDRRQIISVDPKRKTYAIQTFAEMRAQMAQLQQLGGQKSKATLTAKVQVSPTQNTCVLLGHTAREIQARVELQAREGQSDNAATVIVNDTWVAPTVVGYEEVRNFHERMASELNWAPGGIAGDPRMKEAVEAMRKSSPLLSGFSLLSSIKMTGSLPAAHRSHDNPDSSSADIPTGVPSSRSDAVNEALGGLLSLRKRKQNAKERDSPGSESSQSGENVLMTATTEVTAFSNSSLDSSLFEIPAGYRQIKEK
jgi:hypothetical protein